MAEDVIKDAPTPTWAEVSGSYKEGKVVEVANGAGKAAVGEAVE